MRKQTQAATDATHLNPSDESRQRSTSEPLQSKAKHNIGQLPTGEELFAEWWRLTMEEAFEQRDKDFRTPKEVAGITRYSESWVRSLCEAGELPCCKVSGRIHIHMPSLRAVWLRRQVEQ